jgi:uncharacterized sulfatase
LHDFVYAAYTNTGVAGANEYPVRAILNSKFKLIVNLKHNNGFHIKRMDMPDERAVIDSYSVLQSWIKKGTGTPAYERAMFHWNRPFIEMYDLENDPYELVNVASDDKFSDLKELLLSELIVWMKNQNDPITEELIELTGKIK